MTAQLAIKYITDANAAWARSNLGPLDELKASIRREGVRKPVLVQEDFMMLDGARRVVAAQAVGLSLVPVIICHTWADVLEHLRPVEPDCLPMDWPDLVDYWGITLKGLQNRHQRIVASKTRRDNSMLSDDDDEPVKGPSGYSQYTNELAAIYKVAPATIKLLRDYLLRLRRMRPRFPKLYEGLHAKFPVGEEARDLARSRYIKSLIERVRLGQLNEEEALSIYDIRMRESGPLFTYRRTRASDSVADTAAKPVPRQQLDQLVDILEQVAASARSFRNFNIADIEAVQAYVERISDSQSAISTMRKRLETATKN